MAKKMIERDIYLERPVDPRSLSFPGEGRVVLLGHEPGKGFHYHISRFPKGLKAENETNRNFVQNSLK